MEFTEEQENVTLFTETYELGGLVKHEKYENHTIDMFKNKGVDYMFTVDHDFISLQKTRSDVFEAHFKNAL